MHTCDAYFTYHFSQHPPLRPWSSVCPIPQEACVFERACEPSLRESGLMGKTQTSVQKVAEHPSGYLRNIRPPSDSESEIKQQVSILSMPWLGPTLDFGQFFKLLVSCVIAPEAIIRDFSGPSVV